MDTDVETLGIAGGIFEAQVQRPGTDRGFAKSRGVVSARRGTNAVGTDGYAHINAAFLDDLLAAAGDDAEVRRSRAQALRERLLRELPDPSTLDEDKKWSSTASRAEALFGLRRYNEATSVVAAFKGKPAPWELETMARQLAALGHVQAEKHPADEPDIEHFFNSLLPGAAPPHAR